MIPKNLIWSGQPDSNWSSLAWKAKVQPLYHTRKLFGTQGEIRTHTERILSPLPLPTELYANVFGGRSWIRTNNVYLSEQIYSLPQHHRRCRPSVYGAESQNRTDNPSLTKRLLYLLSYFSTLILFWSEWYDSNLQPPASKAGRLPIDITL